MNSEAAPGASGLIRLIGPGFVVGIGYGAGFVIVNSATAPFLPVQYELLRGQYVAGAVLFVLLTLMPLVLGRIIGREYHDDSVVEIRRRLGRVGSIALAVLYVIFGAVAVAFFGWMSDQILTVGGMSDWNYEYFAYFLALFILSVAATAVAYPRPPYALWREAITAARQDRLSYDSANDLIIGGLMTLAVAGVFGSTVYPEIKPEYGGGAIWIVELPATEVVDLTLASKGSVALSSEYEHGLRLLYCSDGKVRSMILSYDEAGRIEPLELMSTSDFERRCKV